MKKFFALLLPFLFPLWVVAQSSDATLTAENLNEIKAKVYAAQRAWQMNQDVIDSKASLLGTYSNPSWITGLAWSKISSTPTTLSGYGITDAQPLNSNLTTIGGLALTNDNILQVKSGAWASRTIAQYKSDLSLNLVENTALSTWAGSTNLTTLGTISTGTWNATAISAIKGGTGQTSFTTGDILYASNSTTISKLAAGTSTYVLTSNGAGVAPSWQAAGGVGGGWATSGSTSITTPTITGNWTLNGKETNSLGATSSLAQVWQINTYTGSTPAKANYYFGLEQGTIDSNSQRDPVFGFGYNWAGSARVTAGEAALAIGMEGEYEGDTEFHIRSVTVGGTEKRMMSFNSNRTTGNASGYITANAFDWRASATGTSYFGLASTGVVTISGTSAPDITMVKGSNITELKLDAFGGFQNITGTFANDVGQYSAIGYNEFGVFQGSNTNFYRFYIDNTYNATNTAAGLSFKLKSVEEGYIYAAGATRGTGRNLLIQKSVAGGVIITPASGFGFLNLQPTGIGVGSSLSTPSALLHLDAGTATAGTAPLKFKSGTNTTTAEAGAMEYNGTNLFFTRAGTTRENVLIAVDNASAPSTSATPTFTSYYGGNTNALGDPVRWVSVNILGTVYKIPLYN